MKEDNKRYRSGKKIQQPSVMLPIFIVPHICEVFCVQRHATPGTRENMGQIFACNKKDNLSPRALIEVTGSLEATLDISEKKLHVCEERSHTQYTRHFDDRDHQFPANGHLL